MKRFKGLLVFALLFISVFFINCSKSYAEEIQYTDNLIPKMTSNTAPSGEASASSYSYTCEPFKGFDGATSFSSFDTNNIWATSSSTGWLAYKFAIPQKITKYTIVLNTYNADMHGCPKNWTFEAWDGSHWVILDAQYNVTSWSNNIKKEFVFNNNNYYGKYRINVTENNGANTLLKLTIGELEMMASIAPQSPTNLIAKVGSEKVNLSWDAVERAANYSIKRSQIAGGPYDTISSVSGSAINFTDVNVNNGKTYYYVVTATNSSGTESANSNEVSVTIANETNPSDHEGNYSTLILTMTNGGLKSYDLSINNLDNFLTWYDDRSNGIGKAYYVFNKTTSIAPYLRVNEYISFDKISSFEVKEFNQ